MKPRTPNKGRSVEMPRALYGVLELSRKGNFVRPASRHHKFTVEIDRKDINNAQDGEIVFISRSEIKTPGKKPRMGDFTVKERLGSHQDVRNYSLLSLLEAGLQPNFPPKVVDSCYGFTVPELGNREDLRAIPLVTIDGEDARDFDDAVYARPEGKGWYAIIAIADVAHYVTPGSPLDKEALRRGNSTYFPDRVVPMLPEKLSNDLCSLRPEEDRACMHVHVQLDEKGQISDWKIGRGLMRSKARLTYTQMQKALDGQPDETTEPLLEQLQNLYKVFRVLLKAREERGALDINAPERKIILDDKGGVKAVVPRERLEAHQLIEELMITANVVTATALESKKAPVMYRVHDTPSALKVATLGQFLKPLGMTMPNTSGELTPALFNTVLKDVAHNPDLAPVINDLVLRSQMQAVYIPENIGHFGLALDRYAHFTSPIRRYADLVNHRALITAFGLDDDGLQQGDENLMAEWAVQISQTERNSMIAERNCVDRFTAHFLQRHIGQEIEGRISSVTSFGLFISLLGGVGEALVPMRMLPQDFYDYVEEKQMLVGTRSGRVYRLGGKVSLTILGVDPVLGSVTGQLLGLASADLPGFESERPKRSAGGPPPRRDDRGDRGRGHGRDRDDKPRRSFGERDDRPKRYDPADKPRGSYGEDRPKRSYEPRGDRPPSRGNYEDRPKRAYGDRDRNDRPGEDRPKRPYTPRGEDRSRSTPDDRPKRSYAPRGDAPPRSSYGRDDDRPKRPYTPRSDRPRNDDDRPKRTYAPRGDSDRRPRYDGVPHGEDKRGSYEDRPKRAYAPRDREDSRPPRRDDGPRPPYRGGRDSKPYKPRDDRNDSRGDDRPRSSYRPRREDEGNSNRDDRPRKSYSVRRTEESDRPRSSYRPRTEEGSDRPKRPYRPRGDSSSAPPRGDDRGGYKGKSDGNRSGPYKPRSGAGGGKSYGTKSPGGFKGKRSGPKRGK